MMKSKYSVILAISVVLAALAAAGCTTTTSPSATATPVASQAPATSATASATTPATSGQSLDFNSLKVLEYKMTTVVDGESSTVNWRWELEPTQIRMKMYSDKMPQPFEITVPRDQASSTEESGALGDAMDPDFFSGLTSVGVESITVPKGPFTCTKYTVTDSNSVVTYWIANNVPVPVKVTQTENGKESMVMELVDYQV